MKTTIIIFAISSVFAACNSKSSETDKGIVGIDTTGLYRNNISADTATTVMTPGTTSKKVVETRAADGTVTTTTTTTSPEKAVTKSRTTRGTVSSTGTSKVAIAQPVAVRKKGWSSRAKGAVIGGVGGAVVGAAVSKKKGKGAVIGGVVGAAGGYIIGNEKDKKTGR